MRLLAAATFVLSLCLAGASAFAQPAAPGPGGSSAALPAPVLPADADARQYLLDARQALAAGRSGEGQEALERAETRLLDRSVAPQQAEQPNRNPLVLQISAARQALAAHDVNRAIQILDGALSIPPPRPGQPAMIVPQPRVERIPPSPGVAYVWVPGHWEWRGVRYVWVGGHYQIQPRPSVRFIPGHWEVRHGAWVWVPAHWG